MRRLKYDFTSLEDIFRSALMGGKFTTKHTNDLKKELNKFFNESHCEQVYYTENNDKMFFGMKVFARINPDLIEQYLMGDEDMIISSYVIEIDSHLMSPVLAMTPRELTSLVLHEVGHVVNDSAPIANARKYLDEYLATNKETLPIGDSYHYKEILAFALTDFVSKQHSLFYTNDVDEILADDFVRAYGYGPDLESAMSRILANYKNLYTGNPNVDKFSVFMWTLNTYKHLGKRRIGAIRTLNRCKALTGSRIEKAEIDNVIRRINKIDDSSLIQEAVNSKIKQRMRKMKYDTMRTLEDDFYELNMRIRNVEDEEDAVYLMRQINTRINLIQDYIDSEDMTPAEVKRWTETLDKFKRIREELANSMVYRNKSYGIFVAYPQIRDNT